MAERKRYIDVEAPILNSTMRVLGTPENLHNKTIKLDLTRKLRGKGLTIKLRIFNREGKLVAIPVNMTIAISYIRKMLRKGTIYVEDSFKTRCADIRITIKPFLITRKKVSRVVRKNLRNTAREFIVEYAKEREFVQLCNEILDGTMQKAMLPKLKKIYPLSFSDIRVIETKELEKIDLEKASILTEEESEDIQANIQEVEEKDNQKELKEENTQEE
jgi:ribosomal protein S3AE